MLSRYGANRFHPTFGSTLQSYIGGLVDANTKTNVYNEVLRVLTNYQMQQDQLFQANPSVFSLSELLQSVDTINVHVTYDAVFVTVQVSNPAGSASVTISPSSL